MEQPTLYDTMTKDVLARCGAILEDARREAEAIEAEARRLAAEQREQALAQAHAEASRLAEEARLRAKTQAELAGRAMQQQVVDELLQRARDGLGRFAGTEAFVPVLHALLIEALSGVADVGTVKAPVAHVERMRTWLEAMGHANVRVEGVPGLLDGLAVEDRVRTFRVTNTLAERLVRLETQARKYCHERLFGGGET